jgi:outer membrane protein
MSRLLPQTTLLTLTTLALTALLASASRAADAEQPLTLPHGSFLGYNAPSILQ